MSCSKKVYKKIKIGIVRAANEDSRTSLIIYNFNYVNNEFLLYEIVF